MFTANFYMLPSYMNNVMGYARVERSSRGLHAEFHVKLLKNFVAYLLLNTLPAMDLKFTDVTNVSIYYIRLYITGKYT